MSRAPYESFRRLGRLFCMTHLTVLAFVFVPTLFQLPAAAQENTAQQSSSEAKDIAATVQSFYNQTSGVEAAFHQTYVHKLYNKTERSKGKVLFVKPGKMRWDYAKPNGKVIVTDAEKLLVFEPGDKGEEAQLFESTISEESLPAAFSFLTGAGKLEDNFVFSLVDSKKAGFDKGDVLQLRPKKPSPQYERVLLYVLSKDGKSTGIVQRVLIVDNQGNRNRFDFSKFKWNPKSTSKSFKLKVPKGTRRIRT